MSSYFSQIRKDPNMAGTVKELSDRIAAIAPSIDDGDSAIRLLRTETDSIAYTDTDNNALDGDRNATDNIDYNANETAVLTTGKIFRMCGGDFITLDHQRTGNTKLRDFIAGAGGFLRASDERLFFGWGEFNA